MSDKIILWLPVAAAIFAALSYLLLQNAVAASSPPVSFTVNNSTYNFTSYALNETQMHKGLMNRTNITNNTFMLFPMGASEPYPFWMKDTYVQLDIIWIDAPNSTGRIVYIANATPCVSYDKNQTNCVNYVPKNPANYVIETRAGFVQRHNISIGESVTFNYG
jgi:uncharacterized membrane protein (UPF0127 family)